MDNYQDIMIDSTKFNNILLCQNFQPNRYDLIRIIIWKYEDNVISMTQLHVLSNFRFREKVYDIH